MPDNYTYLAVYSSPKGKVRSMWEQDHPVTPEEITLKEEKLTKEHGITFLIDFLTLLSSETDTGEGEGLSAKYIVKNLDSKEKFFYDYRSEAIEKFEQVVQEHGKWQEVELVVRIRHHAPSELA